MGLGLVTILVPKLKPYWRECQRRLAEAIEAGRKAAQQREQELESQMEPRESQEETPKYIV